MTSSGQVTALVFILCLGAVPASAQDALTLDVAIQEAIAHNASLRAARAGAA
jgi:hypothetical protein